MRRLYIVFALIFSLGFCTIAQNSNNKKDVTDSIIKTPQQREIDSLFKFIDQQYFEKNYEVVIEQGNFAISLAERQDDIEKVIDISSIIGNAFLQIDDTVTSRQIFENNITRAEKFQNPKKLNAARIDLANLYALQKKSTLAIELYKEILPFAKKYNDTLKLFILHSNISELSLDNNDIVTATYHIDNMNNYLSSLKSEYFIAGAKLLNGRLYYLQNKTEQAITELTKAISIAEEINFNEILIQLYNYLSKAQGQLGQYEAAFNSREKYTEYQEKKYEEDKIKAIEAATAKYKVSQYKQELKEQALQAEIDTQEAKRQTQLFWIKIASGILILFFMFLLFTYSRRQKLLKNLRLKNKQYLAEKEKTEELSKSKSRLFSNMTHELRTPMYGIIGITNLLFKNSKNDSEKEYISTLKFSADYLLSLINNALYFNKIDAEKSKQLHEKPFHIRKLIYNVVDSIKFLNNENPNDFIVEIDKNIPNLLLGDDVKLSQVLMNLLGNASKFTDNGMVAITLQKVENKSDENVQINFTIKDNGIGIHPTKQKEIFKDFVQDSFKHNSINGTGLGLPIVKKILKQHNSKIKLISNLGDGTEVQFSIVYKFAQEDQPIKKEIFDRNALANKRILVVDDNRINRMVTEKEIQNYGASVSLVSGGEEALELLKKESFDLILMDINMPGMDGFETTEHIRKNNKTTPILALTAVEREKVLEQNGFNLMNGIVIKPYKGVDFINTLIKHL